MTARPLFVPLFVLATLSCQRDVAVVRLPQAQTAPAAAAAPTLTPPVPAPAPAADPPVASAGGASPFLSGTTEAHRKSTLTPKVSSAVTRVHVREGDTVKQGQPLVTLDTRDFILRSQQAEAARDGARVQLESAKLDWDRIKSLLA